MIFVLFKRTLFNLFLDIYKWRVYIIILIQIYTQNNNPCQYDQCSIRIIGEGGRSKIWRKKKKIITILLKFNDLAYKYKLKTQLLMIYK